MSKPSDLVQGTLDLLLLKILALEPLHGWAVSEQEGWIQAEWKTSELGRRAKFYELTRAGRKQLERETANWERLAAAISAIVRLKEV